MRNKTDTDKSQLDAKPCCLCCGATVKHTDLNSDLAVMPWAALTVRTRTTLPLDDKGSLLELFSTVEAFDIWSYNVQLTGERLRDEGVVGWGDCCRLQKSVGLMLLQHWRHLSRTSCVSTYLSWLISINVLYYIDFLVVFFSFNVIFTVFFNSCF